MQKTTIEPSGKWRNFSFKEIWEYRELLYFMVWRNLRVRYSQTVIGVLWVILQPVLTMLIFAVIFGKFAKLPSEGAPYAIFVFSALLPWNLFSNSISAAGVSLNMNRNIITKVYFPRIIIPMAKVLENALDFCISCLVLFTLMLFYHILPSKILLLPLFFLWVVILAVGAGLWLSITNVKYRDVVYAVPFLMQAWFYVSPVAYSFNLIPEKWRYIYSLNPMVGIIEGFRWLFLDKESCLPAVFPISIAMTCVIFITGLVYFYNTEEALADII